jgi:serine phosphatase RsbU (regulator of sigma subunit)
MSFQKPIEIKARKRIILFYLLISAYLTFHFGKSFYKNLANGISFASSFTALLNLAFTGISAFFTVFAAKRFSNNAPGLIINNFGIVDNSGLVSAGMIYWTDVTEINTSKLFFAQCIIIKVKNPQRYIKNEKNPLNRLWLDMEYRKVGSPINISINGLKYQFNDLFRILQDRYLSTQVESRTYELKREKDVIQREKKELIDSINYAKRIQTALLPSSSVMEQRLGESFILYLPKDIVSGDFYWAENVNEWVFFAVCDCTGHGVPGALINIVCNNALNRAIREYGIIQPSKILDKVAELIVETIGVDGEVKDGMDASLCAFNKNTRELFWAGANIPLWIARNGTLYELLEFKPDKQSIGIVENRQPYTNHKIEIQKGDILYLASDGYADQFGGELGKKLTRKKFKELLMQQRGKSLSEQQANLLAFHNDYKKTSEQIDDILVVGIRVER